MVGQQPESPVVVAYAGVSRDRHLTRGSSASTIRPRGNTGAPTSSTLMRRITLQRGADELDHSIETKGGTRPNQRREGRIRSSFIG